MLTYFAARVLDNCRLDSKQKLKKEKQVFCKENRDGRSPVINNVTYLRGN